MKNISTFRLPIILLATLSMFQFLPSNSMADINGNPNCMTKEEYLSHNFTAPLQIQECITQFHLRILHAQNAQSGKFESKARYNDGLPKLVGAFIDIETLFNRRTKIQKGKVFQWEIDAAQNQIELALTENLRQDPVRRVLYLLAKHSVLRKKNEFDELLRTSRNSSTQLFKSSIFTLAKQIQFKCFAMLDFEEIPISELSNSKLFRSCVRSGSTK